MTHQYLVHPRHRAAFATGRINRKIVRQQPLLLYSSCGRLIRWRLMLDTEQLATGLASNKTQARVAGQAAKKLVLSGKVWQ